ncbi:MAG: glycine zipper 2TM domain-containing protein [Novosphingobium sp.]
MKKSFITAALALAAPGMIAASMPAMAAPASHTASVGAVTGVATANAHDRWDRDGRDGRYGRYDGNYGRGDYRGGYRDERVSRNTRVWRGDDGRYHCRRGDGTTGLLIGGAVGGLVGNGIAGRGDRTLGTLLGVAGGALLGREVDRSNSRCR